MAKVGSVDATNSCRKDFLAMGRISPHSSTASYVIINSGSKQFLFFGRRTLLLTQLGFQLFNALFQGQVHGQGGPSEGGSGGLGGCEMCGVAPAPSQHGTPPLDTTALLGLFITHLTAANFAHHG